MIKNRWLKLTPLFLSALLFAVTAQPALAWGPLAHRAVCDAAWRHSNDNLRQELAKAARRMDYSTFADACVWADAVRKQPRYRWSSPLHYMNVPRSAERIENDPCHDLKAKKPQCVFSAIPYFLKRWQNHSLSQRQRDEALLFLAHFVADLHQPLHVSYADDRGGTQQQVVFEGKALSLHRLWDSDILYCGTRASWRTLGKQFQREYSLPKVNAPLQWANESLALTRVIYANVSPTLPDNYCAQFHPLAMERLGLAASRLASLLAGNPVIMTLPVDTLPVTANEYPGGAEHTDKVQSAPTLLSKLKQLWKSILTSLP